MRLIKRFMADIRGPNQDYRDVDPMLNEELIRLQTNDRGDRNEVEIVSIREINKDSGTSVFTIVYEDKGLDLKSKDLKKPK